MVQSQEAYGQEVPTILNKQELYLNITPLSQENLKVEEYIKEFQLQITVSLDEELELKIDGFIKGLSPLQFIANIVLTFIVLDFSS